MIQRVYRYLSAGLALGLVILALGCSPSAAPADVVVTNRPIHSLTASLLLGIAKPQLLSMSADVHGAALRPSDARAIADARLVIWLGPTMETSLTGAMAGREGPILTLLNEPTLNLLPPRGHGTVHGTVDPHIWLSITRSLKVAHQIEDRLLSVYPEHADKIASNGRRLADRLQALQGAIKQRMDPIRMTPYLVHHDAFQYFEEEHGLEPLMALETDDHLPPSLAHMSQLRRRIVQDNPACILVEAEVNQVMPQLLADESNIALVSVDPSARGREPGPDLYEATLISLAEAFERCAQR